MKEKNNFAKIYIAVRSELNLTQAELAEKLSCTQSYLSKIEAGDCSPTVSNWVDFCLLFKIPVTAYKEGYLDYLEKNKDVSKVKIKNKKKKNQDAQDSSAHELFIKVRFLIPYIELCIDKIGEDKWQSIISKYDLDSRYFLIRDHDIDPALLLEIKNCLNQYGMNAKELSSFVKEYAGNAVVQGRYFKKYQYSNPQAALLSFLNNIPQYLNLKRKDYDIVKGDNFIKLILSTDQSLKLLNFLKKKSLSQFFLSYFEDYISGTLGIGKVKIQIALAKNSHQELIFSHL